MQYLFKQKITANAWPHESFGVVLLGAGDRLWNDLLAAHLRKKFTVVLNRAVPNLPHDIATHNPGVVVIPLHEPVAGIQIVRGIASASPLIKIITTGFDIEDRDMGQIMEAGVAGHMNRRLTRPADIVSLVEHALGL